MAADDRGCFVGVVKGKGRRGLARAWGLQAIGRARHDEGNSWQSGTTSRLGPLEDRDATRKLFIQGPAKKGLAGRGCLRNERERDERDARPQLDAAVIGHRHRLVTFPCREICPRGLSFTPSSSSNAIIAQLLSLRLCISEATEAIVCATCTYWRRLLAASIVRPTRLALHLAQPRCPRRLSIPTLSMTLAQVLDLVFLPVGFLTRRRRFECLCSISDIRTHTCLDMYKHDRLVRQQLSICVALTEQYMMPGKSK